MASGLLLPEASGRRLRAGQDSWRHLIRPRWWWLLVALAPSYLLLAAILPPADDELYYWCWSKTLQFSYYDHPLMSALMIRLSTAIFGDALWAIRLPALLATLVVLGVVGWLTRPRSLLPLIVATPLFTLGAVLITPDTPLLLFWSLYALWLVRVHQRLEDHQPVSPKLWILGGIVLGAGILGKYTMALAMIAGFVAFLLAGNIRSWLQGYILHGLVAFLTASPILIHNLRHDFVPLLYQWKHSMSSPEPGLLPFLEFAGVQMLLFGTIPFFILGWAVWNRRELLADGRLRVSFCLFVLPFAFFLLKSTRGRLEGNWALACYITLWPLAARWYETIRHSAFWRRMTASAFLIPLTCVLLLCGHLLYPLPFVSPLRDRVHRQSAKLELCRAVAQDAQSFPTLPLFATDYQWTSLLRFSGVHAYQIEGLTRPSHFTQNDSGPAPKLKDFERVLVLTEGPIPDRLTEGLVRCPPEKIYPLVVRGQTLTGLWLLGFEKTHR